MARSTRRAPTKKKSRYEQFKEALTKAAGNSTADYGGLGQFWNTLSLEELQAVKIYGVQMFAPKDEFGAGATPWEDESSLGADTGSGKPSSSTSKSKSTASSAMKKDCCSSSGCDDTAASNPSSGGTTDSDTPPYAGRASASGIITALKGEFPFDGTHFTRMPFGGEAVPVLKIAMIESWIDDGCPETDEAGPDDPINVGGHPLSNGQQAHPPAAAPDQYHNQNGGLKQRKNIQYLNAEELQKLRYAFQQTINLNEYPFDTRSYENWAKIHGDSCQHGWEQFLPWHRAYLHEFELLLQDYVPDVTLPYWDWTLPAYANGVVPDGGVSGIIPPAYRCFINQNVLDNLSSKGVSATIVKKLGKFKDILYNSGIELRWNAESLLGKSYTDELNAMLMAELRLANPLWLEERYPGMFYQMNKDGSYVMGPDGRPVLSGQGATGMASLTHHHYPTADEVDGILALETWKDFGGGHFANQSFGYLEQNPHNTGHIWVGGENPLWNPSIPSTNTAIPHFGQMFVDLVAFYDPMAWGHHSNVDRMWYKWQKMHPGVNPDDLTDVMMPWHYTVQQLLDTSKLGYEYAMASTVYPTDTKMPMTKVLTEDSGIHNDVLQNHSKAEVRIHGLQRSVNSHYIRVFLNSPEADHTTPIKDNDNYVGYLATFGHGHCIGGPGHCDLPGQVTNKFDRRPRSHNTTTNHRFDATEQVKKLLAKGDKDIHVNLVVVGHNGQMAEGHSRALMSAVSLNFFD